MHPVTLSLGRPKQEDHEFEASRYTQLDPTQKDKNKVIGASLFGDGTLASQAKSALSVPEPSELTDCHLSGFCRRQRFLGVSIEQREWM